MKMFLRQLCAASALCCVLGAFSPGLRAAPFDKQFAFTQPDGATIQLHGKGDEFSARFETLDGYTVVFDQGLKAYCFARLGTDGRLVSTGVQPQRGDPVALGLATGLRMNPDVRKQMVLERYQRWEQAMQVQPRWSQLKAAAGAAASGPQFSPPPFTTTGVKVGLTILVDFDDDPATIPQTDIIEYCNGDNYGGYGNNGSVKSYFYDNSNGNLTYSNVVTIYIRAPKPKSTYDDVTQDAGQQGNLLIKDVIDTMKALPNYDTTILPLFDNLTVDGNNQVIACNVFFAGENSGVWAMGLWPHSSSLYLVGAQELSPGGKKIWRYQITDISTSLSIGTFCHENGHMLCGYPDLYDYDYDSAGGAGAFSLMGAGGTDKNPSQIDAYLKRASGWATITELDANTSLRAVLSSSGTNFNHFYRFQKPGVPTEYYLLENRQQVGRDAGIPGSGIAIWHCDELGDRDNQSTAYNTSHANYELTLVQADNQWDLNRNVNQGDTRDLYYLGNPAPAYANEFSDKTTPSARWWDGSSSGFTAGDFSASGITMTCRIGLGAASLKIAYVSLTDRNGNGVIDYNECTDLSIVLTNGSLVTATNVQVTLTTTTPGVYVAQNTSRYPDVPPASLATNLTPFRISTAPDFVCGTPINLVLSLKIGQILGTDSLTLTTGVPGVPVRFDSGVPVAIPDPGDAISPIIVSNFTTAIKKVTVSLYVTHTWDQDLTFQLISPSGITNNLSISHGLNGDNYGAGCGPDILRTTFDDDAALGISLGQPPFIGSFQPDQPLSIFIGKGGTNVNGVWLLRAIDAFAMDSGVIQCWSLNLTPAQCVDGTGECPGSDLALGMTAAPEPVVIGNNLIYTLSVTNFGPSSATNVNVSQILPAGSVFVSATASQGAASHAGGVVTCNLGRVNPGRTATVTVVTLPTTPGVITSAATVSSEQTDFNTDNNSASVVSHVNPPTAELAVSISAVPNVGVLGSPLVYTVAVTNNGPSAATLVTVSNVLPSTATIVSATLSQGFATTAANGLVYNFNTLAPGGYATATITVIPNVEGSILTTASVGASANLFDPIQANNFASLVTTVGPAADLAVSLSDYPDPVVRSNILTYVAVVTNRGPSLATAVVLNHVMAPSVVVVSSNSTQGAISFESNTLTVAIGDLPVGGSVTLTVQARPTANGVVSSSAAVSGSKPDPNGANNSVLVTTLVADPFVSIVRDAATLMTESFAPANGTIDIGETVTLNLRLRNAGNIDSPPVQALLLATNGVVPAEPNTVRNCGVIPAGFGNTNLNAFTFTAAGTNGGTVTAVLQLQYGLVTTNVSFVFSLPTTRVFSNTNSIAIRDANSALPYPSAIVVSNLSGLLGKATVTFANISHGFPQDIAALLVAPTNQNRTILMCGAGAPPLVNETVTFDDAASQPIPDWMTPIFTASYSPANYLPETSLPSPAPAGPYPASMSAVNAVNPNGPWSLYVADLVAGDDGQIAGGWSLALTMVSPVNQVADVSVAGSVSPSGGLAGSPLTYTFVLANAGPAVANSVAFTNVIPSGTMLLSAVAPAGATLSTNAGQVVVSLASLAAGSNATVTVVLVPTTTAVGTLTSVATVAASETDLNTVNNTATLATPVNLPAADVAITRLTLTNDLAVGTNLIFTIQVTNQGPADALQTVLTDTLPAGLAIVSTLPSAGTLSQAANTITWNLGTLAANSGATLGITAAPIASGAFTNTAVLSTASADPVATNNTASLPVTIAPQIVAGAAVLTYESLTPPNGSIDSGETVTVSLGLRNVGTFYASNLVAELLPGSGVANVSGAQVYGPLLNDGTTVARPFTFTASGPNGGTIVATLNLRNGAASIGTVSFVFNLPNRAVYSSTAAITIPAQGIASPYPSIITVGGLTGVVGKVAVTINSLTHTFPRDVNLLLVNPVGASVVLMSHAGGGYGLSGRTFTIDDSAASALPADSQILATSYRPTAFGSPVTFPVPAPARNYASTLSALNGTDPNGDWKLYVYDDSTGDGGVIGAGWSLDISVLKVLRPVADMALGLTCVPGSFYLGATITNTITVTNLGSVTVDGVTVTNVLPAGAAFVRATLSQGAYTGSGSGPIVCQFGSLAAGASASAAVVSRPSIGGTLLTTAQVVANAADLNTANNSAQATVLGFAPLPATIAGAIVSNAFNLTIQGQPNFTYMIKVSTDLNSWQTIDTRTLNSAGSARFVDPTPPTNAVRFYRAERVLP